MSRVRLILTALLLPALWAAGAVSWRGALGAEGAWRITGPRDSGSPAWVEAGQGSPAARPVREDGPRGAGGRAGSAWLVVVGWDVAVDLGVLGRWGRAARGVDAVGPCRVRGPPLG